MQNVDCNFPNFQHGILGQVSGPCTLIDIAANRRHRRDSGKLLKDFGRANISGMNDVSRPSQRLDGFGTQQTMRVGDDADQNWALAVQR